MKKKNYKIIVLMLFIILLTGCTKTLRDEENRPVKYEKTGQNLTEDIFCQPKDKEVIKLYEENNINIEDLPMCKDFKLTTGGYEGIWTTFFVKPLAYIMIKIGSFTKNYGLAVILSGLLIRIVMMPITKKSAVQSENMKKAQPELQNIEKKYKDKKDQESLMKKSQETMLIYKKHQINPLYGCLFALIQLPLFLSFLQAINRIPAIFEERFITLHLGTTPYVGIGQGNVLYIVLIIAIISTTYYSFKLTSATANSEQQKQMKFMLAFMLIFITFASFNFPAAIALYWITSSIFTIGQNLLVKRRKDNESL